MTEPAGLKIWTLIHIALSHCVDLGLHREPNDLSGLLFIALAVGRLIFYTVYSLDRYLHSFNLFKKIANMLTLSRSISTIQGRPLGILDETFDVRRLMMDNLASSDTPVTTEGGLNVHLPSAEYLAFTIRRFQLDLHIAEIKFLFHHLPSQVNSIIWHTDIDSIQQRIKTDLDKWLVDSSSVVSKLDTEVSLILHCKNLKLELQYHAVITLLYQPCQVFRSPTQQSLFLCYQSSSRRLRIYEYLDNEEQL